jgi:hypothetical protein
MHDLVRRTSKSVAMRVAKRLGEAEFLYDGLPSPSPCISRTGSESPSSYTTDFPVRRHACGEKD